MAFLPWLHSYKYTQWEAAIAMDLFYFKQENTSIQSVVPLNQVKFAESPSKRHFSACKCMKVKADCIKIHRCQYQTLLKMMNWYGIWILYSRGSRPLKTEQNMSNHLRICPDYYGHQWCVQLLCSQICAQCIHDDVIKWKPFLHYWSFVRGIHRSSVNSHHKGQWRRALMFSLICAWINGNPEAGDLRRHCTLYDFTIMVFCLLSLSHPISGDLCNLFTNFLQGYFAGTGATVLWLPPSQWNNPAEYG